LKETDISTNAFGSAVLWKTKLSYNLGGAGNSVSTNSVTGKSTMPPTTTALIYVYFDGRGRVAKCAQSRRRPISFV